MKRALLTIAIGESYQEIARLTHPGLGAYAREIGADFISLNAPSDAPFLQKFRIAEFLGLYDRILFMDSDIVVTNQCPDVLALVPADAFGAWFPSSMVPGRFANQIARAQAALGDIGWTRDYFNSGVMVFSSAHAGIFQDLAADAPFVGRKNWFDQTLINYRVQRSKCRTVNLGFRWNHTRIVGSHDRLQSHFIHYAGPGHIPGMSRIDQIRSDLHALGKL